MSEVLALKAVRKHYSQGASALQVLRGVNLSLRAGEVAALVGPSGCGKSTLLQIAGLLDSASGGEIFLRGENMTTANDASRTLARRRHIGFVYQFHHLLPDFSARENIAMPLLISGMPRAQANARADALLSAMGLSARAQHRPGELSGGEQQRVAIARALAPQPSLLLADEPTGNLDPDTSGGVFEFLMRMAREHKVAALVATHNPELARRMDRVVSLRDGHLTEMAA